MKHENPDRPRRKAVALDPHPLCHTALTTLLARFDIDLVGAATSARAAETLLQEHRPDLLVMEIDLAEGHEAAFRMISSGRERSPELTVIVLSGTDDRGVIDAAFDCGAAAYVLKTSDPEAIATAIRQAFEPSLFLAPPQERTVPATDKEVLRKLTRRELEILQLVSGGRSNRQVAEILWVADQTVKFHLANIYRKLGVRSRFEAARWARESGILDVVVEPESGDAVSEGSGKGGVTRALVPLRSPRSRRRNVTERLEETSR
jgi:DNA-binding NarL/FixJ family response regulator